MQPAQAGCILLPSRASYLPRPASLLAELRAARPPDEDQVLVHGDYCLPNVAIDGWALSGFIDLGRCGVADRYHDLAQAARSVRRNLGERWVAPVARCAFSSQSRHATMPL